MKGVFNKRPSLPRYTMTWDVELVLNYMATMNCSSLFWLSAKLCMLFLLLTAQRCQTLHMVCVSDVNFKTDRLIISTPHLLKQSKPGHHLSNIVLKAYPKKKELCILHVLKQYLGRTESLRGEVHQLLISTQKPHRAVSKATISRWVKVLMGKAGIDSHFGAHSTRAATSSSAKRVGAPINVIVNTAGWANAKTFGKFYDKPVVSTPSIQSVLLK